MIPRLIGIVNLTEDSFSDAGRYLEPAHALAHAERLLADGAHAIDLGAAASHPEAKPVPPELEISRLEPVVAALRSRGARISIDSFAPATQRWALARGVDYLNDIEGFRNPELYPELAGSSAGLIVMHSVQRRGAATRVQTDPAWIPGAVFAYFEERITALEGAGIARKRLILDPGMGFFLGANPEPSVAMLRELGSLRARFGLPVLVCVSRKSFLGALSGAPVGERLPATLAAELYAAARGVDFIRTHDVRALARALAVVAALRDPS